MSTAASRATNAPLRGIAGNSPPDGLANSDRIGTQDRSLGEPSAMPAWGGMARHIPAARLRKSEPIIGPRKTG